MYVCTFIYFLCVWWGMVLHSDGIEQYKEQYYESLMFLIIRYIISKSCAFPLIVRDVYFRDCKCRIRKSESTKGGGCGYVFV